jgi:hypothetical protein
VPADFKPNADSKSASHEAKKFGGLYSDGVFEHVINGGRGAMAEGRDRAREERGGGIWGFLPMSRIPFFVRLSHVNRVAHSFASFF